MRLIAYVGVDEKAAGRGQRNYVTIVCDIVQGTVEEVTTGPTRQSLLSYFASLTDEQRRAIQAVAMGTAGWRSPPCCCPG